MEEESGLLSMHALSQLGTQISSYSVPSGDLQPDRSEVKMQLKVPILVTFSYCDKTPDQDNL